MDNSDRRLFSMNLRLELDNLCVADSKYMGKPRSAAAALTKNISKLLTRALVGTHVSWNYFVRKKIEREFTSRHFLVPETCKVAW